MNASPFHLEVHAKAIQEKRMQQMLIAQRLSDANVRDIHPARRMFRSLRIAIGNAFLIAGERISGQQEERAAQLEAAQRAPKTA